MTDPSPATIRSFIEAQLCPWCGEGPFKMLAGHTYRAHGVDRFQLREMAGLVKGARVCDPEHSQNIADRLKGRALPASAYERAKGVPRIYGEAGLEVQRAKLGAARSPERTRVAAAASAAKTRRQNADKYEEVLRLFSEGILLKDIAEQVGLGLGAVKATLERHGLAEGLLKRRSLVRSPEERQAHMDTLREAALAKYARDAAALVASFMTRGGDYDAVRGMASEANVRPRVMAERLRNAGAEVPDGRTALPSRYSDTDLQRMAQMYANGLSQSQIAAEFGCNQAYVSKLLRAMGAATRGKGWRGRALAEQQQAIA